MASSTQAARRRQNSRWLYPSQNETGRAAWLALARVGTPQRVPVPTPLGFRDLAARSTSSESVEQTQRIHARVVQPDWLEDSSKLKELQRLAGVVHGFVRYRLIAFLRCQLRGVEIFENAPVAVLSLNR